MFMMSTVIITGSASLRVLNFHVNPNISDDGMSIISSELQYNNVLTELRVPVCGLTAKGMLVVYGLQQIALLIYMVSYHS